MPSKTTSQPLLCPACGSGNTSGPLCSACGKPLRVHASKLVLLMEKRLALEGFQPTSSSGNDKLGASLRSAFAGHEGLDLSALLFLPMLSSERPVTTLNIAAIVTATPAVVKDLPTLAKDLLRTSQSFFSQDESPRPMSMALRVYVVYPKGITAQAMAEHSLPRRSRGARLKRGPLSLSVVRIMFAPIDAETGTTRHLDRYRTSDRAVLSAVKQLSQPQEGSDAGQAFFPRLFQLLVLKPLATMSLYRSFLSLVGEPEVLAYQIRARHITAGDLSKAIAVSAVFAALIAQLFRLDLGGVEVGMGMLNTVLDGLILMLLYLAAAVITHWPLRLAGGKGSFRDTFVANTFVGAVAYPLMVLLVGGMVLMGASEAEAWRNSQVGTGAIAVTVLAPVHGISWRRTLLVLSIVMPLVLVAVLTGFLALVYLG